MARFIPSLRRSLLSPSSSSSSLSKIPALQQMSLLNPNLSPEPSRTYAFMARKSAADGNLLRIIRHEIEYELQRSSPNQRVAEFNSFTIDDRIGQKWIRLNRNYGANEAIEIEATMFSGSEYSGSAERDSDLRYQIDLIVSIYKEGSESMLEILCSAWLDSIQINKLRTRKRDHTLTKSYLGPGVEELDDKLHDELYEFLEERGINDKLAAFLHSYMKSKENTEYIRWMKTLKSFIEE